MSVKCSKCGQEMVAIMEKDNKNELDHWRCPTHGKVSTNIKITLQWFKDTGKWYTDEVLDFPSAGHNYYEIIAWVREEKKYNRPTPYCLVTIEGNDVPKLITYPQDEMKVRLDMRGFDVKKIISSSPTRRFYLHRAEDESGVSGTGRVAEGAMFPSTGQCIIVWNSEPYSMSLHKDVEALIRVHGHNGKTEVIWID